MKKWLKILFVIACFALISVAMFFILKAFGITDVSTLKKIIENSGPYAKLTYIFISSLSLTFFCFVPLLNTSLAIISIVLFEPLIAFACCLISNFISGSILFFIGDKFGEKLAKRFLGNKEFEETQDLIDTKSKIWLPIMFIIPGVPDEALCLIAGMTKMKYWYLILVSLIYHTIEIGLFCFLGSSLIDYKSLRLIDWIIIVNLLIVDVYLLKKFENFLENKLKSNKKD